jgi:hypothetical protein
MAKAKPTSADIQNRLEGAFINTKPVLILPWETPNAANQVPAPGLGYDIGTLLETYIEKQIETGAFAPINPLHRGHVSPFLARLTTAITRGSKEAKFK